MDYQKLSYFFQAAYYLNFSKAAEACHVTQATMSRQIKTLEDEIGVPLFIRKKTGLELTVSGEYLMNVAKRFMQQHQDIILGCQEAANCDLIRFRVALGPYEHLLFEKILFYFLQQFPNAQLLIDTYTYNFISSRIQQHSIAFAVCIEECLRGSSSINSTIIYEEPWQVAAREDSPFWEMSDDDQAILKGAQIITGNRGNCEPISSYCLQNRLPIRGFAETSFFEAQKLMLANRSAVALFPPFVADSLPKSIKLKNVLAIPLCPKIVAAYDSQIAARGCKELLSFCKDFF